VTPGTAATDELERLEHERDWSLQTAFTQRDGIWWPKSGPAERVSYPDEGHRAIAEVEDASYWFRHRNRAIARMAAQRQLGGALWDIGAGTGVVAAHLQRCGVAVIAVEPGPDGARVASDRGIATVVAGTLEQLALPEGSIAAVGLFDVIEHLERPAGLLQAASRVLRPGGTLLVSVPAYQWLWSHADDEAGHFRRYTVKRLDRDVVPCGFRRVRSQYLFHSLVVPLAIGRTLRSKLGRDTGNSLEAAQNQLKPSSRLASGAITAVLAVEDAIDRWWPPAFGTSILAAYEREATPR
jgi:2-polyprenyl-3-methyl-5-hydroxy-6-metoxy-1,4-benzoquinol methylase